MRIRDPRWKKLDPGSGIEKSQIRDGRDKHHGSATLLKCAALLQRSLGLA
jgi:hypothetical protein